MKPAQIGRAFYFYKMVKVTRKGFEPLNIELVKTYLRISQDDTDEESVIHLLILGAVDYAEKYTGQQLNTELDYELNYYAVNLQDPQIINLKPRNTQKTITTITVNGTNVDAEDYTNYQTYIELHNKPNPRDKIIIKYTSVVDLDDLVKYQLPLLKIIADAYMNREEQGIETLSSVNLNAQKYLHQFQDAQQWL